MTTVIAVRFTGKPVAIITYSRSKTHKGYSIQIRPEIREQLDWFQNNYSTVEDYLLPCVTIAHKGEVLTEHIINKRRFF